MGPGVVNFSVNDEVCGMVVLFSILRDIIGILLGILPLDSECPGCAEYCIAPQYCLGNNYNNY